MNKLLTLKGVAIYFLFPYLLFHILTLSIFPLPWLDEVFMADITQSLAQTNKYYLNLSGQADEILLYGPVYFNLQVLITNLFGFDAFQFRLLGFVSGMLVVLVGVKILQYFQITEKYQALYILLVLLQEVFFRGLHFGRMDLTATLLVILSLYLYLKYQYANLIAQLIWSRIVITILLSAASLTTPRTIFLLLPFGILFFIDFWESVQKKNTQKNYYHFLNLLIILGVASSQFCWLFYKYGNINTYLAAVYNNNAVKAHAHIMNFDRLKRFGIQTYLYIFPSILSFFASFVVFWKLAQTQKIAHRSFISFIWFVFASIFTYFILVVEPQPYTVMLFPFAYLAVVYLLALSTALSPIYQKIKIAIISLILFTNLSACVVRMGGIFLSYKGRNPEIANEIVKKHIKKGSKVVADYKYFYSLQKNQNQLYYRTGNKKIIAHQEEILDYDYLLVEDSLYAKRYRNEKSALVLLTKIDTGTDLIDLAKKLDFLGSQVLFATYDGYLYKRIRKN